MSVGSAFGIDQSVGLEFNAATASSANGMSVVVWVENEVQTSSGDEYAIKAQLYNASGNKIGGQIGIAGSDVGETSMARRPSVSMDGAGNFIVVWTLRGANGKTDVAGGRWTSAGKLDFGFANFFVGATSSAEYEPSVAMFPAGDFVVSYTVQSGSSPSNVVAKQYTKTGGLVRTISVASNNALEERFSDVAVASNGQFNIVYQRNGSVGQNPDVILNRYGPGGVLLGTVAVAASSKDEWAPKVAMDNAGNSVVAWYEISGGDRSVFARKVSNTGAAGSKITVRNTSSQELNPTVAMHRSNGSFVVAYDVGFTTSAQVMVSEVSSSGTVLSTTSLGTKRYGASVSMNGSNRYFVAYTASISSANTDIHGRFGKL